MGKGCLIKNALPRTLGVVLKITHVALIIFGVFSSAGLTIKVVDVVKGKNNFTIEDFFLVTTILIAVLFHSVVRRMERTRII